MNDRSRIVAAAVGAVFLGSRLLHLTALPMFIDESIYLFWAKRIVTDGRFWRPLADGKSLQVWVLSAVVPWVDDPLWWGRAVSVAVGALGAWAAWAIGRRLHGGGAGLLAAALYVVCPFALFHDRMVLADVFVSTAGALVLLASLDLVDAPERSRGIALGLALGACALSKMPGLLLWGIPLFAVAARPSRRGIARPLAGAFAIGTGIAAFPVWYFFENSAQVREQGAFGAGGWAAIGLNLATLAAWLWRYWTPAVLAVFAVASVRAVVARQRDDLVLAASALWPPLVFALLARSWFPRYVFPSTIPALVLVAVALSRLALRLRGRPFAGWAGAALGGAILLPALAFDAPLVSAPDRAPFPEVDRQQYVEGWTAGYGCEVLTRALGSALRESPRGILVGVGGVSRHAYRPIHLLLRAHFMNEPRVELQVSDPADPESRRWLAARAEGRPVFLVAGLEGQEPPVTGAPPVAVGRSPDGAPVSVLYRLPPAFAPH